MDLDTVNAMIEGYEDRLFDQQLLQVHGGFWSGYYTGAKRPKSLKAIITKMVKQKDQPKSAHADTVDVEAYKEMERKFNEQLRLKGGVRNGRRDRNKESKV